MYDKRLKRLSREELLEMLIEQKKEVERLKMENQALTEQLKNRRITIAQAGSIAEAALRLNGIFEIAQRAADEYLENVQQLCEAQSDEKEIQ